MKPGWGGITVYIVVHRDVRKIWGGVSTQIINMGVVNFSINYTYGY